MSSSSEEELKELLRHGFIQRPRNFEERRLFDMENPREFSGEVSYVCGRFCSFSGINKSAIREYISRDLIAHL